MKIGDRVKVIGGSSTSRGKEDIINYVYDGVVSLRVLGLFNKSNVEVIDEEGR